jgi:hypothetical protein
MTGRGLLLTMTEPLAAMDEEFNAWYDSEHVPERLSIRGFRSARRWVADAAPGEGRYLATYELDSPGVLKTQEYLARFEDATPWTRRCLEKAVVFRRWACEQTAPGQADPHPAAKALLLVCGEAPLENAALPGALQVRHFQASAGMPRYVTLFELARMETKVPAFGIDRLVRWYRAYAA